MNIKLWGTRGSLSCSGSDVARYGGNTACVQVTGHDDTLLILDAGTGIRRLGYEVHNKFKRINILLTHMHLDHIQGLGFFTPLFDADKEVHIYGPASTNRHFQRLLTRYLSPPLFPVFLRELPCDLHLHAVPFSEFQIGQFQIFSQPVCHPGLTLGYNITSSSGKLTYLPDHEPAIGVKDFPQQADWTSGYDLAKGVDILIHDAQYTDEEYLERIGWGHSSIKQAIEFSKLAQVKMFVPFHHDPSHSDDELDLLFKKAIEKMKPEFKITPGQEGYEFKLP